ncbi:Annexin [Fasciolopsis buskii]|uniref:Annexin n=1 Tax=Fasciolopsis buskii TaxID=27845 RepID=A0A8E0RZH9_9TREM|nr:Annexin [Fasciolopsis buski]
MSRQLHHRILIGPNGETYHPTLKAPASFNAEEDCKKLRAAMKGLGKLYFVRLKLMLNSCVPYTSDASRTLESDIEDDLSGCLKHLCIALLQADRDELSESQVQQVLKQGVRSVVNMELVQKDIEELYDAGTGRLGTDESTFIRILVKRSVWHLYMVNKRYEEQYGKSLMKAIESETSGDFENALKLTLFTCLSRPQAYAALLYDCMAGAGTQDETLMRIIVSRCEIDLGDISKAFEAMTEKTLEHWVRGDTSGDYRKILLTLMGVSEE